MLLKHYHFDVEELPYDPAGNLPSSVDPKLALAQKTLSHDPVEVNHRAIRKAAAHPRDRPDGCQINYHCQEIPGHQGAFPALQAGIAAARTAPSSCSMVGGLPTSWS